MLANFHILDVIPHEQGSTNDSVGSLKVFFACSIAYFAIHSFILAYWNF